MCEFLARGTSCLISLCKCNFSPPSTQHRMELLSCMLRVLHVVGCVNASEILHNYMDKYRLMRVAINESGQTKSMERKGEGQTVFLGTVHNDKICPVIELRSASICFLPFLLFNFPQESLMGQNKKERSRVTVIAQKA